MPEIKIIDTTLRDAHQCLWATRMTTAMMLPVAEAMDRTGFEAIDLMSAIQFDVCVRYLKEDPWQRLRLMRERVTRTKMQSAMRSNFETEIRLFLNNRNQLFALSIDGK